MAAGTEGVQLPVPSDLRDEFLWQALKIKVLHPDQFLPVTDVKTRTSDDGKGTYREMTLHGSVIIENIYLNESALEVVFVKEDGGGEHYNAVITDAASSLRTLKFGLRDSATKMALHWAAPADVARGGIQKVFDRARLLQEHGSAGAAP